MKKSMYFSETVLFIHRCIHKLEASIDIDLYQKLYTQKNTNKNLGYINQKLYHQNSGLHSQNTKVQKLYQHLPKTILGQSWS